MKNKATIILIALVLIYLAGVMSSLEGSIHPAFMGSKYFCRIYNARGVVPVMPCVRVDTDYITVSYRIWPHKSALEHIMNIERNQNR